MVRKTDPLTPEEALARWPNDPPPTKLCGVPRGHRTFWRRPTGGWVCATCHPAVLDDVVYVSISAQKNPE